MAILRAALTADLLADANPSKGRFVIDPDTGRIVMPVEPQVLDADEHVLLVPEESDQALELLVILEEIDGRWHPGADRWRSYHGEPRAARWAWFAVDCARHEGAIVDGEEICRPSALHAEENVLRRAAHRLISAQPAEVVARLLGRDQQTILAEAPVVVGVDEAGLDVRVGRRVARLLFPSPALDAASAGEIIQGLLAPEGP